jgi:hypothetical protein
MESDTGAVARIEAYVGQDIGRIVMGKNLPPIPVFNVALQDLTPNFFGDYLC